MNDPAQPEAPWSAVALEPVTEFGRYFLQSGLSVSGPAKIND